MYTIAETAARTGLSVHTLRYYERAGLLPHVERSQSNGHRRYSENDLTFIEFLKRLRATGMPIAQMQRYACLMRLGSASLEERRAMLISHGEQVRAQLAELQANLAAIDWKIEHYRQLGLEKLEREKK